MMLKKILYKLIVYFSVSSVRGNKNNIKGTQINNAESCEQLVEKVRRLESIIEEKSKISDDLRSTFLKNVYHEIRTPMNSIVGFTNLLEQKDITDIDKTKFTENIRKSSKDFLRLIDDLVEASLLDSGEYKVKKGEFSLSRLMNDLYDCFADKNYIRLNKHNISLVQNPDSKFTALKIYSDRNMLFGIMSMLISNAFKFTKKGIIEFGYRVIDNHNLMFFVKDTGMGGLGKGDSSVFNSFTKSDHCFERANKGFGLGLNIAKSKVELLKGEIWVESNELKGTTFKFTIPVETPDEKKTDERNTKNIFKKAIFKN